MRAPARSALFSIAILGLPVRVDGCIDAGALGRAGDVSDRDSPTPELVDVHVDRQTPAPINVGPPIATVELESGSTVYFLELERGRVGVAESAPERAPLLTDVLVRMADPTPLEMFLALAPGTRVPDVLRRDHAASTGAPPRALQLPPLSGVPFDFFDCDPPDAFEEDWHDTYDGVTEIVVSETYSPLSASAYEWYPGYQAYAGIDNLSTHFGICSADTDAIYSVSIHSRIDANTWHHHVTAMIGYKARLTFHSNVPGVYRMRFTTDDAPISGLAAGAAYTPSPSEAIPGD